MKNIIVGILILFLFTSFRFGEVSATLNCKSASGRTTFKAELPSCSYLESAELNIDNSKLEFDLEDRCKIIFDPANKVFTVYLESKDENAKQYKFLRFWAIPSTFKKVLNEKGSGTEFHDMYEFKGNLETTDPRNGNALNKTIELSCVLDYQL